MIAVFLYVIGSYVVIAGIVGTVIETGYLVALSDGPAASVFMLSHLASAALLGGATVGVGALVIGMSRVVQHVGVMRRMAEEAA